MVQLAEVTRALAAVRETGDVKVFETLSSLEPYVTLELMADWLARTEDKSSIVFNSVDHSKLCHGFIEDIFDHVEETMDIEVPDLAEEDDGFYDLKFRWRQIGPKQIQELIAKQEVLIFKDACDVKGCKKDTPHLISLKLTDDPASPFSYETIKHEDSNDGHYHDILHWYMYAENAVFDPAAGDQEEDWPQEHRFLSMLTNSFDEFVHLLKKEGLGSCVTARCLIKQ